jgi:hypothetical protein
LYNVYIGLSRYTAFANKPVNCTFIITPVYMWNKFYSCIMACSTSLAQSKEGSLERKLYWSIQYVPSFRTLLSHA